MREGTYIEKYRRWDEAITEVTITKAGIRSRMSIGDIVKALKTEIKPEVKVDLRDLTSKLKEEIGSIALTFRADTFTRKIDNAMQNCELYLNEQVEKALAKTLSDKIDIAINRILPEI